MRGKLDTLLKEDSIGFIVRSRFQQNAEEERASLYHAGRELNNKKSKLLRLKSQDKVLSDQEAIEEEVVGFFGALFNGHHDTNLIDRGSPFIPDNTHLQEILGDVASMDRVESEKLEVDISIEELDFVIKKCATNKAPGLDGISYEFYKCTWDIIKETFLSVLQCQLNRQQLIQSDKIGVTRLIPKVSVTPKVDELRPITLLNCDYKILSKVLVLRMKPVMPLVIKSGLLCSVGSKNILFGASNILSSILYVNQRKLGACLLSLDFFKAYDWVFIPFLLCVMKKMGFGAIFCQWIGMLHAGAQTRFILASLSRAISVSFSIRQGDPIAMLLYIIYIEPLLVFIEKRAVGLRMLAVPDQNNPIIGNNTASSCSQCIEAYCDDVNVLTSNEADLVLVDQAVCKFEAVSGAILSRNKKCSIMGLGTWKNRINWPLHYIKVVKDVKIFGIFMHNSYMHILKLNWEHRFRNFEKAVFSWSSRVLNIFQRVEVIKVFGLSRTFYVASFLPLSKTISQKFEKLIRRFIWSSSGHLLKVALEELKLPTNRGGLGLKCIHRMGSSLSLTQTLRLLKYGEFKSKFCLSY